MPDVAICFPHLTHRGLVFPWFAIAESWELARRLPNFEEVFGTVILLKMFDYEPQTKKVFGFAVDYVPCPQELKDSGNLQIAISIIQRLDAVLNLLGPDAELVSRHLVVC